MKILGPPMSGSIAGLTAAIGGGSQVLRRRAIPTQPLKLGFGSAQRPQFVFLSQQWAKLTPNQQKAWASFGAGTFTTDSLGQRTSLTGFQAFMQISNNLETSGVGFAPDPPATRGVFIEGPFTLVVTHAPSVIISPAGNGTSADVTYLAFTKPVSNGVSTPRNFVIFGALGGDDAGPDDFTAEYVAQFGAPPKGSRVFCKLTPVSEFGIKGHAVTQYTVVT